MDIFHDPEKYLEDTINLFTILEHIANNEQKPNYHVAKLFHELLQRLVELSCKYRKVLRMGIDDDGSITFFYGESCLQCTLTDKMFATDIYQIRVNIINYGEDHSKIREGSKTETT